MIQQNEGVHFGESQQKDIHEEDDEKKERLANSLMEDANQHTDVLTEELEGNSKQHTNVLSEEEEVLRPCNFSAEISCVNYAGKEEQQMEIARKVNKKETMLAENIVKDHHFNMVIRTVEMTLEAEKKDSEDFLSLEEDLELQREELVTGSSIETIGSCDF